MGSYEDQTAKARAMGIDFDRQVGGDGTAFYCLCGCGETTKFNKGKGWSSFKPGHDARLVARLLTSARRGQIDINDAIAALDHTAGDKLANKLRRHWLRVSNSRQDLVEAVKRHAASHYNDGGWDVIVECWDDQEIASFLAKHNVRSLRTAIAKFKSLVSVWADRQADAHNNR